MATVTGTDFELRNSKPQSRGMIKTWGPLTTTNDVGDGWEWPFGADKCVQVVGTFGSGGTVKVEGTNDGTNWVVLTDPQGNALSFTAAGIEAITENPWKIRPHVTAGDGTTSLTVTIVARRPAA